MDLADALVNVVTVAAATGVIMWVFHGRFRGIENRIDRMDDRLESFRSELKADMGAVRSELGTEIGSLRSELRAEIAGVRSELSAGLSAVRSELSAGLNAMRSELGGEIGALRSDLTAVALAVGARPRTGQTGGHA